MSIASYTLDWKIEKRFLALTARYPWECSEFIKKVGYLSLAIIYHSKLQMVFNHYYKQKKTNALEYFSSVTKDCLWNDGDGDTWSFNTKW